MLFYIINSNVNKIKLFSSTPYLVSKNKDQLYILQTNVNNDLKKFKYITKQKHKDLPMKSPYLIKLDNGIAMPIFAEPEEYRWLLKGKYLSETHKTVFRHICWNCFFKLLPTIVDIKRAARKSKWYKSILEGKKPIPLTNIASSDYFKLLFDITDEVDGILLCSDGLTNMLSDDQITKVLNEDHTAEEKLEKLIIKSNNRGGTDNISIAYLNKGGKNI